MQETAQHILETYIRRLTNLSGNNRLLFLPRLSSEQFLDLHELSQLNQEASFSIIEALITGKKKVLCPTVDSRMEASNEASKKLKKLQRADQFLFDEHGSKDLHVGWPFVRGKFSDGTLVRCPLLFFPAELAVENNMWVLRPRYEADITFNKAFLLAYSFYNKVPADDFLLEEDFEEFERDAAVFRISLYHLLQKASVEVHFNPDTYRDKLISFTHFKKDEFEQQHHNGQLKLFPEAVLGIFPQAGSFLVPDYLELQKQGRFEGLESFFASRNKNEKPAPGNLNFIPLVKEDKIITGFSLDAWQENALKAVKLGHSLVVQGPPGTGKSHLICNLMADAMATGKSVLVVCQKRAALDVVYQRMKDQNLADFLALVHDFKNDRKEVYQKIAKQIERIEEYKSRNNSLDAIQLDRKFLQVSHRISQILEELSEFKEALYDDAEFGAGIKELYMRSDPAAPSINLKQEYQHFKLDQIKDFQQKIKAYAHYARQFESADHPWRHRKSFAAFTTQDLIALKSLLDEIPAFHQSIASQLEKILSSIPDWIHLESLQEKVNEVKDMLLLLDEETYPYFQHLADERDEETSSLWLENIQRVINDCYRGQGPEVSVSLNQLGIFQKALSRSMKARKSLIGLVRWELFSEDKFLIKRTLVANGLTNNRQGFKTLEAKLDSRLNLEHNLSKLKEKSWLLEIPETYDANLLNDWCDLQLRAIRAKLIFNSVRGLRNFVAPKSLTVEDFKFRIKNLYQIIAPLPAKKLQWENYLNPVQIEVMTSAHEQVEKMKQSLIKDFDALCEYDKLNTSLNADEQSILHKLFEVLKEWNSDRFQEVFLNSIFLAWINHLETKHPVLRQVSSGKLELMESELRELIAEKNEISNEIMLLRVRERVIEELEFNRLNNRVTYRDLHHQVTKKKKIWPIRKLISETEAEIFRLLPCWLASPESVSAMLPLKEIFDLVIFDEASQCFAERGIPAMVRGKQVMIAGDDKQLRPSDLYQVRWQDDADENPDLETDSLLKVAERYLPQVQLNGHYRSQSPDLIEFSNHHFYGGHLKLLPDALVLNQPEPVIEFLRVPGTWEDNTNPAEAEKAADLVLALQARYPHKEVGVITFNAPQQALILDRVEEKFTAAGLSLPESLFVKNIENVQGDEKEIIIFSIGYAPDKKGKVHAQFGSLNAAGGENRLNVAVSRAREKIYVVCSIGPEDLNVEETKNAGPKLLKQYLQYALDCSEKKRKAFATKKPEHKKEWYLKARVKAWVEEKFKEVTLEESNFPFADLVIRKNNEYYGLLLMDDELYHQALSVKDPHAIMPLVQEKKNWKHTMSFSRNYWLDKEKFFNEVGRFLLT